MPYLEQVKLNPLMAMTSGRLEINISLIDGLNEETNKNITTCQQFLKPRLVYWMPSGSV